MTLTADTITDEQIRGLLDEVARTGSGDKYRHALIALGERRASPGHTRHESRARCAEILNARAAKVQP